MNKAEEIVTLANTIKFFNGIVKIECSQDVSSVLARVALGFKMRGNSRVALRAMVEDWSIDRIVREVY